MTPESSTLSQPGISAETGYELADENVPLRISGFISLLLGLLSILSIVAVPLLVIPVAALLFGFFALRRYDGPAPPGVRPAKIGLVLAAGLGACGFFLPWMKTMTLGHQAEYFARQYLEVIARGELELAVELRKGYANRYMATMPLKTHYSVNEAATQALDEFSRDSIIKTLQELGPDAEWELDQATRIYYSFGLDRAELILVNHDRQEPFKVYMQLSCQPHRETGVGQWQVDNCTEFSEPIVAESVL